MGTDAVSVADGESLAKKKASVTEGGNSRKFAVDFAVSFTPKHSIPIPNTKHSIEFDLSRPRTYRISLSKREKFIRGLPINVVR
jgi:hypothetical protein